MHLPQRYKEVHSHEIIELAGDWIANCTFVRCEFTGKARFLIDCCFIETTMPEFDVSVGCVTGGEDDVEHAREQPGGD